MRRRNKTRNTNRRRAVITLELLMALPIWLVVVLATIEFGQMLSNLQQLALASRVGAEAASHTPSLPNAGQVPTNVLEIIDQQLQTAGLTRCRVILEHDVGAGTHTLVSGNCTDCEDPGTPLPSVAGSTAESVRVTVCAPGTALAPNLLSYCGFDLSEITMRQSTTFRYEDP
jgi:Flp pilus assembly protein TadG